MISRAKKDDGSSQPGTTPAPGAENRNEARPRRLSGGDAYSSLVGILKYLLPAVAVALLLLVVAWPRFSPVEERFSVGLSDLQMDQPTNSTMVNARFDGIDDEGRPYRVTADQATQRPDEERLVDLTNPSGDILTDDETWIAVTSDSGLYDKEADTLDLEKGVTLFHDQGYEMKTESARVYMKLGRVVGEQPVDAQGPSGSIQSEGIRVENRGAVVYFTGPAHMTIFGDALKEGDGGAAPRLPGIGSSE
ncbi:MAG: LPS export ABC transporter periplasmic protein LptC [Tistlia sp.]|uniref:LPS export ABC transporter periplasmic protein LptC n=1 Tax=Tistlia sp. TaxID=3057121 RepID=UPI0034A1DA81